MVFCGYFISAIEAAYTTLSTRSQHNSIYIYIIHMPLILQIRHFINIQYTKFNPTPLTSLEFVVVVVVVFVFVACCFCCHCCLLCCGRDTPLGWFHKVWASLVKWGPIIQSNIAKPLAGLPSSVSMIFLGIAA